MKKSTLEKARKAWGVARLYTAKPKTTPPTAPAVAQQRRAA